MVAPITPTYEFLSTLSLRRATAATSKGKSSVGISIHALLAESDQHYGSFRDLTVISIHALLAESDQQSTHQRAFRRDFYPRSPCGERPRNTTPNCENSGFLSTLSLRRATLPCQLLQASGRFLSTLSLRRATGVAWPFQRLYVDFYPRSPCGERRQDHEHSKCRDGFLSTLSLRRATAFSKRCFAPVGISIHALLAESDPKRLQAQLHGTQFLSTLSLRRATLIQQAE